MSSVKFAQLCTDQLRGVTDTTSLWWQERRRWHDQDEVAKNWEKGFKKVDWNERSLLSFVEVSLTESICTTPGSTGSLDSRRIESDEDGA